jgi:hypothetical protein
MSELLLVTHESVLCQTVQLSAPYINLLPVYMYLQRSAHTT